MPEPEVYALTITVQGGGVLNADDYTLNRVAIGMSNALHALAPHPAGDQRLVGEIILRRTDNLPRREIEWRLLGHFPDHSAAASAATAISAITTGLAPSVTRSQAHLYAIPTP